MNAIAAKNIGQFWSRTIRTIKKKNMFIGQERAPWFAMWAVCHKYTDFFAAQCLLRHISKTCNRRSASNKHSENNH